MELYDAQQLHQHALDAMTQATQGIEAVTRVLEVYTARDAGNTIPALKYATPSTPEEEAYNAEIDQIMADFAELGPVATALDTLFSGTNRTTMMRLRTDA